MEQIEQNWNLQNISSNTDRTYIIHRLLDKQTLLSRTNTARKIFDVECFGEI